MLTYYVEYGTNMNWVQVQPKLFSREDVIDLQEPSALLPFFSDFTIISGTGSNSVGKIVIKYWISSYKNRKSDATLS